MLPSLAAMSTTGDPGIFGTETSPERKSTGIGEIMDSMLGLDSRTGSNLGLLDRSTLEAKRLRNPDLGPTSVSRLRRKDDWVEDAELLEIGDGMGVGGTFGLSSSHHLKC